MMPIDASMGYVIYGAMLLAFTFPFTVLFVLRKFWWKFDIALQTPVATRAIRWLAGLLLLYLCYVVLWLTAPVLADLFPIAIAGAVAGYFLSSVTIRSLLLTIVLVLLLAVVCLVHLRTNAVAISCSRESHGFKGIAYDIEICTMDVGSFHADRRLRIYTTQGELIAQRFFTHLLVPGSESTLNKLAFGESHIEYTDADPQDQKKTPKEFTLRMPPTAWDWFRANYWPI